MIGDVYRYLQGSDQKKEDDEKLNEA